MGCSEQAINPILNGKRGISPELAKALGDAFDVPAEFFANLQQAYDLAQARKPDPSVAARRTMQSAYPVREMIKRGWIEQSDTTMLETQLVRFFNVNSLKEIPYFPHSSKRSSYAERNIPSIQLAWLLRVQQIAQSISVTNYSHNALRLTVINDLPPVMTIIVIVYHIPL